MRSFFFFLVNTFLLPFPGATLGIRVIPHFFAYRQVQERKLLEPPPIA